MSSQPIREKFVTNRFNDYTMPIKLIGRTTDFKGKPLWEILGNLKNFGVGRLVIRNRFQRYPEPCYMKILKVAAMPLPDALYVSIN